MEELQTYTGIVITAESLAKRWAGMHEDIFAQHLEDAIDGVSSDFPPPLCSKGTRRDQQTGELVTAFTSWKSEGKRAKSVIQRYQRDSPSARRGYCDLLGEIVFKYSEIEEYEEKHPEVLDKLIDPDKELAKLTNTGEKPLTRTQLEQKLRKAHAYIERLEAQIEELEIQLTDMQHGHGKSVAPRWRESVNAAFALWARIVVGGKQNWKEEEFYDALNDKCNCLTEVASIAWRELPDKQFKHGSGRPKKTP